jgi:hypothetical protein
MFYLLFIWKNWLLSKKQINSFFPKKIFEKLEI